MPFNKKKSIKLDVESAYSVQKSQSNPEILERTGGEDDVLEVKIRRKDSWFSRIFKFPFRKKRRSMVDLSDSSTFYTPPPSDFLQQVTNREDGGDKTDGHIEVPPRKESLEKNLKRGSIKRVSKKINAITRSTFNKKEITNTKEIAKDVAPQVTYDLPPDAGIRTNLTSPTNIQQDFLHELKNLLKNPNQEMEDDDNHLYHNVSDLRNEASSRRYQQRPLSEEIEHIYERTWDLDIDPSPSASVQPDLTSSPRYEETAQHRVPALLKFPKPRPPVDRRPSSRLGKKPEVIKRKDSLVVPTDTTVVRPANRRSNAELDEIIQKLVDIPAPLDLPFTPPTPKRRSKFLAKEPLSTYVNTSTDLQSLQIDNEIVIETEPQNKYSSPENDKATSSEQPTEYYTLANKLKDEVHPTNIPLRNRTYSLPKIKIYRLSSTLDDDESDGENIEEMNIVHVQSDTFKRWNTLPTSYKWKTSRLKQELKLLESSGSKEDTQQLSDPLPLSQDCSTQTSLTLLKQTSLEEALQIIKDANRLQSCNDQTVNMVENTLLTQNISFNTWEKAPLNKEETVVNVNTANSEATIQNVSNKKFQDSSKSIYGLPTSTLARSNRELTDNTSSNLSSISTENSVTVNKADIADLYDMISDELRVFDLVESGFDSAIPKSLSCDFMAETTEGKEPTLLENKPIRSITPEKPTRIGAIKSRPPLHPKPSEFVRRGALRHKRSLSSDELETPTEINQTRFKYPSSYEIDVGRNSDFPPREQNDELLNQISMLKKSKSLVYK